MIRPIRIPGLLAFIGLIVVILAQSNDTNADDDYAPPPPRHTPPGPIHSPIPRSYATGMPAIRPHPVSSSPGTPSFTVDDVKAYIPTATEPRLVPVLGAHLTIEQVLFVLSKEATQLMRGESPGLPDDALVCFVLLKGPFYVKVGYAPGTLANPAATAPAIAEVFDAHTGNILVWTVLS
ncbi:MAG TPA: hypothetical protein VNG51_03775 [Ktedonobacteraceae bacterium]|nr:hypothetical protein [Ktedonobacteraceae bacterium]